MSSADFFQINFLRKIFPEQYQSAKRFGSRSGSTYVGADLGPNCLLRSSADSKMTLPDKELNIVLYTFTYYDYGNLPTEVRSNKI